MEIFYPIYYHIYRIDLTDVFVLMLCITVFCAAVRLCLRNRLKTARSFLNAGMLLFVIAVILYYTVFKRSPRSAPKVIFNPLQVLEEAKQHGEIYRALTMNVLLFFPFGIFFSCLLPERWRVSLRVILTVFAGTVLSFSVEYLQYVRVCGDAETADVIANMIGTAFGAAQLVLTALIRKYLSPAPKE